MRGIIELPLEKGKKELCWYVGQANVDGLSGAPATNPTINLSVSRDADFVAKKKFLVRWPTFTAGPVLVDPFLGLPDDTSVLIREGTTKRGLALTPGYTRSIFSDANPNRMASVQLGMSAPQLILANTNLLMEIARASAAATAWQGDLYAVYEGFKVYPYLPEDIPAKIKQYALDFDLDGNQVLNDPSLTPGAIAGQLLKISNDGSGKFLAKRMFVRIVDATNVDVTDKLLPCMAFNIKDSTSGNKEWVTNNTPGASAYVPVVLMTMAQSGLFFNTPRYIDPNGLVTISVAFSPIAGALAYVHGAANWPVTMTVNFNGALMPR
jgi:hypothetical protein